MKDDTAVPPLDSALKTILDRNIRPDLLDGKHRLICGDATVRGTIDKESIDLIVTSPPYNVGKEYDGTSKGDAINYEKYLRFSKKWLANCYHWTKNTGRMCVNVSIDKNKYGKQPLSADITRVAMHCGWKYHATILWNEGNISRRTAWGSWKSASAPHIIAPVEVIIVLYKGEWKRERQGLSDISGNEFKEWVLGNWQFNGESGKRIGHEAPFPRELPKRCIKLLSFVGDTVLDPFAGSGTTLIEAMEHGRFGTGIEMEKRYCALIRKRVEKECEAKYKRSSQGNQRKSILNCWEV